LDDSDKSLGVNQKREPLARPIGHIKTYDISPDGPLKQTMSYTKDIDAVLDTIATLITFVREAIRGEIFNIGLVACNLRSNCLIEEDDVRDYSILKMIVELLSSKGQVHYKEETKVFSKVSKKYLFVSAPSNKQVVTRPNETLNYYDPYPWPSQEDLNRRDITIKWILLPWQCEIYCEKSRSEPPREWIEEQLQRFQLLATWLKHKKPEDERFSTLQVVCTLYDQPSVREEYEYIKYSVNLKIDQEIQTIALNDFFMIRGLYCNFVDYRKPREKQLFVMLNKRTMNTFYLLEVIQLIHKAIMSYYK
jgi:hypothetical protein